MYKFDESLYPSGITYHYARSVFNFFQTQEQAKYFFKYLFYRLNEEYKRRKKGENVCVHVLRNDSDNYPLLDLNYNFFVFVLAEWIEHYSVDEKIIYEYSKYRKVSREDKDSKEIIVFNQKRDLKIECSIKERVLFDYSFSGWLTGHNLHKNFRYDLMQILMNNILGKHTFIPNYSYRLKAVVTKPTLVFDTKKNENILFVGTSFFRSALANYYSNRQMNLLKEMGEELKKVTAKKLKKNENGKFEIDEKIVQFCDYFDIDNIENERDLNDGIFHNFVAEKETKEEDEEQEEEVAI